LHNKESEPKKRTENDVASNLSDFWSDFWGRFTNRYLKYHFIYKTRL